MPLPTIAILMPGDMGHGVGRVLREHGYRVITCLAGRSARTRGLAAQAGLEDTPDLNALVTGADLILSILPPGDAMALAQSVAAAMTATGEKAVYVECNAISPDMTQKIGSVISGAGAPYIDAGIIGLAPGKGLATRFYVSGDHPAPMVALHGKGIEVYALEGGAGAASGLKMCYAGLTKGKWSLYIAVLLTAHQLGLFEALKAEFEFSQPAEMKAMRERVPRVPADAGRWIAEMENIAETFASAGLPSGFHDGAAEIFRLLNKTPFAAETRETIDTGRTLEESLRVFAECLPKKAVAS